MNLNEIIEEVYFKTKGIEDKGQLADYIPDLANVNANKFAVHITTVDHQTFGIGDYSDKFSIQSIAKVLSLCLIYRDLGKKLWERVGVEPSGTPFNSLMQLEADNGIPRNPFINAGAIVVADVLISHLANPKEALLNFVRRLSNNPELNYSAKVAASEKSVGFRNVALCNFIKSFGNIKNDPAEVLDFYFDLCSIEMNCQELSNAFLFMANNGYNSFDNSRILTKSQSKRMNALMQTCGFYDESGEFAFKVGLPGKSGVSGGIIAIYPNNYAIAVWSPKLNPKGNSYKGIRFLEEFTTRTELSIF